MTIEITGYSLHKQTKVLVIEGIDMTKTRDIHTARARDIDIQVELVYDTTDPLQFDYITNWLHRQKITKGCSTYGEALQATVGTVTVIRSWYS